MIKNRTELAGVFQENSEGVMLSVRVLPRSSRCAVAGVHAGALKLKLTKPPVDGEANAECCRFMAKLLGVSKSQIIVARGAASRQKALQISGLTAADACERLAEAISGVR
jgi:uncharacterized protein (TIGR00251 family)